jgi:hypothetical protein
VIDTMLDGFAAQAALWALGLVAGGIILGWMLGRLRR